jgi:hypothetical protein
MSALGQKQTSRHARVMSALPPIADIHQHGLHVRLVPQADIRHHFAASFLHGCDTSGERHRSGKKKQKWRRSLFIQSEMYVGLAKNAYKPVESALTKKTV